MPLESMISSTEMLNINCTVGLMQALGKIQKKMAETEGDWEEEKVNHEEEKVELSPLKKQQTISDNSSSGFFFVNRLHLPCSFQLEGQSLYDLKQRLFVGMTNSKNKESLTEA